MEAGLTSLFEQVHLGFARRPRVMDGDQIPIPSARPTSCQVTIDTLRFWVIRSFRHRGLKRLFLRGDRSVIQPDLIDRVEVILALLDVARSPQAMRLPGYRLHALKGGRKGYWSVRVSANWRVIFRFEGEDVYDVELIDYH